MMAGAVGFWPEHLSFYELRQAAAGAKPEIYHEPTRKALLKHAKNINKGPKNTKVAVQDDPKGFWGGLKAAFTKGKINGES